MKRCVAKASTSWVWIVSTAPFLRTIVDHYGGGPVGISAIAATLTEDAETLEDVVEPYLLKHGFVVRTASGRKATPHAYRHLGSIPRSGTQERLL